MLRYVSIILFILSPFIATAQGYFYTEGTVQVNTGSYIEIKGDAVINASIDGDGYMTMNGDNPQYLGGSSANMNKLLVTNGADVLLADPVWVNDDLWLMFGMINLGDYPIYLGDSSTHSGNNVSFLQTGGQGYVQRKLDTNAFTFHTGYGNEYFPITLAEFGTPDTFRAQAWNLLPDDGTSAGAPINTHVALLSYSLLDLVPGGNVLDLQMQWRDTKNAVDFTEHYAIGIRHNGTNYVQIDDCPTNVANIDPNIVAYSGITNTGTFGIGDSIYLSYWPTAFITPMDTTVCPGQQVIFTAYPSGADAYLWSNGNADTTQSITSGLETTYYVDITDSLGCTYRSDYAGLSHFLPAGSPLLYINDSVLSTDPGFSSYQWYLNGSPIPGATSLSYTMTVNGIYWVQITNVNGCTNTSLTYDFTTAGIENENTSMNIFQQNENLILQLEGDEAKQVFVYDALGKVVYHQPFTTHIIPLQLSHGVYVVRVMGEKKEYVKKMVW